MAPFPGFIAPAYTLPDVQIAAQRCLNLYLEQAPDGPILRSTPGLQAFASLPDAPFRGGFAMDGRAFVVSGGTLYELSASGAYVSRGTVARDGRRVSISSNGAAGGQLLILSAGLGYVYDLDDNTLTQITDDGFPSGVVMGGFLDGYGLVLSGQNGSFQISDLEDFSSWDASDTGTRNQQPDNLRALLVAAPLVVLFGSQSTALWYDSGAASFPFAPVPGVDIKHGIAASDSACLVDGAPMWLASNGSGGGMVLRLSGNDAQRVSTHAIESAIQSYTRIDDAEGWSYQQDGHTFYVLSFPEADHTWVYDVATQAWHERGYLNPHTGQIEKHRARGHVYAYDTHLVGDWSTGDLYALSTTTYSDNGDAKPWVRSSPHVRANGARIFHTHFELEMGVGKGTLSGQGADPIAYLRTSNDGGETWGPHRAASLGARGVYGQRVFWDRNGSARSKVYEVSGSDPVPVTLANAYLEATEGRS